jgi:nucleotide-binding universal stress UspA family protein
MHLTNSSPILFPTDFESHSLAAFEHAQRLAAENHSKLIALHVCNMPDMPWSSLDGLTYHEALQSSLRKLESDFVGVEHIFTVADPGPEICRLARELNCGSIFMGITSKQGMDQCICGSTHEYVQQNAPCPVVTFCQQPEHICS